MEGTSVAEIHQYSLRPKGYEEPLFPTPNSRKAIMEHLLEASWLHRASEMTRHTGEVVHVRQEPVEIQTSGDRARVIRLGGGRRCGWKRRRVVEVLDRWREVEGWWDEERRIDRLLFRVLLSGGEVVDLARERSGEWILAGVID